jgi:hypothetical protein
MDTMHFMARLYALLGECSPRDLERAAAVAGRESDLGHALKLLAAFRKQHAEYESRQGKLFDSVFETGVKQNRRIEGGGEKQRRDKDSLPSQLVSRLREVIVSNRYFKRKSELANYLERSGLPVRLAAKESRSRIFLKVLKELQQESSEERMPKLERILSVLPTNETARWFEVIRRGS